MPTAEPEVPTLNGLDWAVIVAATVALVVMVVWLYQQSQHQQNGELPTQPDPPAES